MFDIIKYYESLKEDNSIQIDENYLTSKTFQTEIADDFAFIKSMEGDEYMKNIFVEPVVVESADGVYNVLKCLKCGCERLEPAKNLTEEFIHCPDCNITLNFKRFNHEKISEVKAVVNEDDSDLNDKAFKMVKKIWGKDPDKTKIAGMIKRAKSMKPKASDEEILGVVKNWVRGKK
jgi:DNA-directed RNA polymerase subunit RPC12/RpoP